MVTILIRAIELAVSAPFQALAAIRAAKTYEHDPYDDWAAATTRTAEQT